MSDYEITGYQPGALGWCVGLHGRFYAGHAGFDAFFETKVATEMAAFIRRLDPPGASFFLARDGDGPLGTVSIDMTEAEEDRAHLRWFIVEPRAQGRGIGGALIDRALLAARDAGARGVYLWTFDTLVAARGVYLKSGFRLMREQVDTSWGMAVNEQRYEIDF